MFDYWLIAMFWLVRVYLWHCLFGWLGCCFVLRLFACCGLGSWYCWTGFSLVCYLLLGISDLSCDVLLLTRLFVFAVWCLLWYVLVGYSACFWVCLSDTGLVLLIVLAGFGFGLLGCC